MFLITWDDIYRSSILVRIYILIVPGRKAMGLGSLSPWDKEDCLCLKSLQFLVLPDCSLILDRSYSSHWQDMRPKPRQILTSSSVKFRWSDWKGCPCSLAHVSEAIYYRTKPFAPSNNFFFAENPLFTFLPLLALAASVTGSKEMFSLMCFLKSPEQPKSKFLTQRQNS